MRDADGRAVFFKAGEGALNGVLTFRIKCYQNSSEECAKIPRSARPPAPSFP
jgi:hypothetical protein